MKDSYIMKDIWRYNLVPWKKVLAHIILKPDKSETVVYRCSVKKVLLKILQNSQENMVQVFSCEFGEILKNTFFIEHLWWLLLKGALMQIWKSSSMFGSI